MNWYRSSKVQDKPENFNDMERWFEKRTKEHISKVQKYCRKIEAYDVKRFDGLIQQAEHHDQSKFEPPEREPYIYITWKYKCEDDGVDFELPDGMEDKMNKATEHHVLYNNRHHPEFHSEKEVDLINREDRDKPPEEMVDATKMPDLDIGEMCADWFSMSEERGGTPKTWADKNVNVRWKFNDDQKDLIYELIDNVWE